MECVFMAGDWIKMRYALTTDPKVGAIGRHIQQVQSFSRWATCDQEDSVTLCDALLRNAVIGALHAVWCAVNEHSSDGRICGADLAWIDTVSGIEEMGAAMQSVGWATIDGADLVFPKFNSNNTSAAERQKRYREKKSQSVAQHVTSTVAQHVAPRVEKRREEKITKGVNPLKPPARPAVEVEQVDIPVELDTPEVRQALKDWLGHHQAIRKPYRDPRAVSRLLAPYARAGPDAFVAAVNNSIANNYQGLFPPKDSNGNKAIPIGAGQRHDPSVSGAGPTSW